MTTPTPAIGSVWQHKSGRLYTVLCIANHASDEAERYPATVVYQDVEGNIWSRRADDWDRSMTLSIESADCRFRESDVSRIEAQVALSRAAGYGISLDCVGGIVHVTLEPAGGKYGERILEAREEGRMFGQKQIIDRMTEAMNSFASSK